LKGLNPARIGDAVGTPSRIRQIQAIIAEGLAVHLSLIGF
jgi:hypothetical protein